jgi:hypothetical protein
MSTNLCLVLFVCVGLLRFGVNRYCSKDRAAAVDSCIKSSHMFTSVCFGTSPCYNLGNKVFLLPIVVRAGDPNTFTQPGPRPGDSLDSDPNPNPHSGLEPDPDQDREPDQDPDQDREPDLDPDLDSDSDPDLDLDQDPDPELDPDQEPDLYVDLDPGSPMPMPLPSL